VNGVTKVKHIMRLETEALHDGNIAVRLDGEPTGSWDGTRQTIIPNSCVVVNEAVENVSSSSNKGNKNNNNNNKSAVIKLSPKVLEQQVVGLFEYSMKEPTK
jgi:hypothetical protein